MTVSCVGPSWAGPAITLERALFVAPDTANPLRDLSDRDFDDIVDEWGAQSFPASDPPSNW
jgi:hypothetical protein